MVLCLFVVVQMLGVPVTLLNPVEAADTLTVSVSDGFSIPSSIPQLTRAFNTDLVTDGRPSIHCRFAPLLYFVLLLSNPVSLFHTERDTSVSREMAASAFPMRGAGPLLRQVEGGVSLFPQPAS